MLWFALAIASVASQPAPTGPTAAVVQATATLRIISGVRLTLHSATNADAPAAHRTTVTADGSIRPAQLIEFE
jgi:hypothetical protein